MNRKRALSLLFIVASSATWLGCGSTESRPPLVAEKGHAEAEAVWRSKCGSCHVPIAPGTRGRDTIEAAADRHRARLGLTPAQWNGLVEFLATPQNH